MAEAAQDRRYTTISYNKALTDLQRIARSKFGATSDFSENSYTKALLELFAGSTDLWASYAENAFKQSFLETCTQTAPAYAGARSLGYSVRRPVPAKCTYLVKLKKTGENATVKLTVPKGTTFTGGPGTITAIEDCVWLYTRNQADYTQGNMHLVSGRAILAEGLFKTYTLYSAQVQNQTFTIPDLTFSNWFGDGDPSWMDTGVMRDRSFFTTTVVSDASMTDGFDAAKGVGGKLYWRISRRGLYDPAVDNYFNDIDEYLGTYNKTTNYTALLDTGNDGNVRVRFGDGVNAAIPYGEVSITYFSTSGLAGNKSCFGDAIKPDTSKILITQEDGSESDINFADLVFNLSSDSRGGVDIESIESIKRNAPQVYSCLDSLGDRSSYMVWLCRQQGVKYANAYGEDILKRKRTCIYDFQNMKKSTPDLKYSNVIQFSLLKDLYTKNEEGNYVPTPSDAYYVQGSKLPLLTYAWQYDYSELPTNVQFQNTGVKLAEIQAKLQADINSGALEINSATIKDIPTFMKTYFGGLDYTIPYVPTSFYSSLVVPEDFIEEASELWTIMNGLKTRGYLTLGAGHNVYTHPTVHWFNMKIDAIVLSGASFTDLKVRVINKIYEWLAENTAFAKPIYQSNITTVMHTIQEITGAHVEFVPYDNAPYSTYDLNQHTWLNTPVINRVTVDPNGFDCALTYTSTARSIAGETASGNLDIQFSVGDQKAMRERIANYYKANIAYYDPVSGKYKPRADVDNEAAFRFCGYVWSQAMAEILAPMFRQYQEAKRQGDVLKANSIYNVMEAFKGWYTKESTLAFIDTETISSMAEVGTTLYDYIMYCMEYIKLILNVLDTASSKSLIDNKGDLTKYSSGNEIVQFRLAPDMVTLSIQTNN